MEIIKDDFLGEKYYKYVHPSGLTVYIMPKENTENCFASFSANYGSVDTRFGLKGEELTEVPEGIAHFLEHKLFESEELDAFERYAKVGASGNAFTSFDRTSYIFSCADKIYESLEILIDFVTHPYFTEETVQKEQGIIGQEIGMYRDNPDWRVFFNLLESLYEKNPVRIDIAGTVDSIARINAELLYKCYNCFYNMNNMVLAVVGNVDEKKVIEIVDRLVEVKEKIEVVSLPPEEKDEILTDYTELEMKVNNKKFALGFKEIDRKPGNTKEEIAVSIALNLICNSNTEFYNDMIKEGLINNSFSMEYTLGRGFAVTMFTGESENPLLFKEKLLDRITFLRQNGIDDREFEAARRTKYGNDIKAFNYVETMAYSLVESHFYGTELFDSFEVYRNITKNDILAVLNRFFDFSKCALSVVY